MSLLKHLTTDGLLDARQKKEILGNAKKQGLSALQYLIYQKIISANALLEYSIKKFSLPRVDLKLNETYLRTPPFSAEFICQYRVLALQVKENFLFLAVCDPTHLTLFKRIAFLTEKYIQLFLVNVESLENYLRLHYPSDALSTKLQHTLKNIPTPFEKEISLGDAHEPISEFVTGLINSAAQKNVSDIHLEPLEYHYQIRFRQDGLLNKIVTLPHPIATRVITRLKILANLNIAERRLPQDGHIRQTHQLDLRVSTCPTQHGEKMVLRLLNTSRSFNTLTKLGMSDEQLSLLTQALAKPQGMIIVTGPTGSGKTVTLYSALKHLNHTQKNIITIEDPIEIFLEGINQINVHTEIGLSFATILQAILRQDPDVIMVGEIRDFLTAKLAMQAALTGHLVLTTLHTNSAAATFERLRALGIDNQDFNAIIHCVIAQRLVRRLCDHCKNTTPPCNACHSGYLNRCAIFECMKSPNDSYASLWESGLQLVTQGITTYEEIVRVLGEPN